MGGRARQLQFLTSLGPRNRSRHGKGQKRTGSDGKSCDHQQIDVRLKPLQAGPDVPGMKPEAADGKCKHRCRHKVDAPPEHPASLRLITWKRYSRNMLRLSHAWRSRSARQASKAPAPIGPTGFSRTVLRPAVSASSVIGSDRGKHPISDLTDAVSVKVVKASLPVTGRPRTETVGLRVSGQPEGRLTAASATSDVGTTAVSRHRCRPVCV